MVSLCFLWSRFRSGKDIEDLRSLVSVPVEEAPAQEKAPVQVPIDFVKLQEINPQAYAWLEIPNTVISYPILQHPDEPSYYLKHSFDNKSSVAGSIYTQHYNTTDFSDYNTVIYGHNMKNGSMFGQLKKYRNRDFFNENREITVYMPGRILKYTVFAAYTWNDDHLLLNFDFNDPIFRDSYWRQILALRNMNSIIAEDVAVTADDHVITLSTCTANDNQRFLVQAVLTYDSDAES